ncbi:hypothetical protein ACFWIA_19455 [Streptomyces sp. NPDC127068]|uniref:hypothetical protein n=1 Tax=Streptomyces sp. NPDC127068 TaxID=3347127 RepID=UPI00365C5970
MSVFTRFLRKPKKTADPAASDAADTGTAATEVAGDAPAAAESERAEAAPAAAVTERGAPTETVEIPKQQSAERAADNEAGEGARK